MSRCDLNRIHLTAHITLHIQSKATYFEIVFHFIHSTLKTDNFRPRLYISPGMVETTSTGDSPKPRRIVHFILANT